MPADVIFAPAGGLGDNDYVDRFFDRGYGFPGFWPGLAGAGTCWLR